jgi:hypothetical protein
MKKLSLLGVTLGAALLFAAAPFSLHWSPAKTVSLSLDRADARIGRPLTPGSVAGVHRRVYRRTVRRGYYGAAAGAAAAGAYYYGRRACGYYPYPPCY